MANYSTTMGILQPQVGKVYCKPTFLQRVVLSLLTTVLSCSNLALA